MGSRSTAASSPSSGPADAYSLARSHGSRWRSGPVMPSRLSATRLCAALVRTAATVRRSIRAISPSGTPRAARLVSCRTSSCVQRWLLGPMVTGRSSHQGIVTTGEAHDVCLVAHCDAPRAILALAGRRAGGPSSRRARVDRGTPRRGRVPWPRVSASLGCGNRSRTAPFVRERPRRSAGCDSRGVS